MTGGTTRGFSLTRTLLACLPAAILALSAHAADPPSRADIIAHAPAADWQTISPDRLMVLQLPAGQVVIELAPELSPLHLANLKQLIAEHYFDGLAIVRVQDNFVVQWDDPQSDDGGDPAKVRSFGHAAAKVAPEFTHPIGADEVWTGLPDGDPYAPQVGFVNGFPAARDPATGSEWLVHCYGMVGVGRDIAPDSGNSSALYAVIGQAPRRLDRNLAVIGRVISGISLLSSLPRGTGPMGFYAQPGQRTPLQSVRLGSDLPPGQAGTWQQLRTDSTSFSSLLNAQRQRHDAFYQTPLGRLELCAIEVPVRQLTAGH